MRDPVRSFAVRAEQPMLVVVAASPLPPRVTVVPDVAALDLETDNAAPSIATTKSTSWSSRWSVTRLAGNHQVVRLELSIRVR
jgi:hypothetical protein